MKLEVNLEKKYFFTLLALGLVLGLGIFVYAFNSNPLQNANAPATFGHSGDETQVIVGGQPMTLQDAINLGKFGGSSLSIQDCDAGKVLTKHNGVFSCETVGSGSGSNLDKMVTVGPINFGSESAKEIVHNLGYKYVKYNAYTLNSDGTKNYVEAPAIYQISAPYQWDNNKIWLSRITNNGDYYFDISPARVGEVVGSKDVAASQGYVPGAVVQWGRCDSSTDVTLTGTYFSTVTHSVYICVQKIYQ